MDPEALLDSLTETQTSALVDALERRGLLARVLHTDAVGASARLSPDDFFSQLSPAARARAEAVRAATGNHFGVANEDVAVIPMPGADGGRRPVVILTSGNGLKMGLLGRDIRSRAYRQVHDYR